VAGAPIRDQVDDDLISITETVARVVEIAITKGKLKR
jgi:hypothetical protein